MGIPIHGKDGLYIETGPRHLPLYLPVTMTGQWHVYHRMDVDKRVPKIKKNLMMTSSNGSIFRVTGLLCRDITGPR